MKKIGRSKLVSIMVALGWPLAPKLKLKQWPGWLEKLANDEKRLPEYEEAIEGIENEELQGLATDLIEGLKDGKIPEVEEDTDADEAVEESAAQPANGEAKGTGKGGKAHPKKGKKPKAAVGSNGHASKVAKSKGRKTAEVDSTDENTSEDVSPEEPKKHTKEAPGTLTADRLALYKLFKSRVAKGKKLGPTEAFKFLEGRVKMTTVKWCLYLWKRGESIPAGAKEGAVKKKAPKPTSGEAHHEPRAKGKKAKPANGKKGKGGKKPKAAVEKVD